jgi:hypothetical protein
VVRWMLLQRSAAIPGSTNTESPATTFLDLSDDITLCIKACVNDLDCLNGLRSWHPRWEFDYYCQDRDSDTPDRWRREYMRALCICAVVWRAFRIIKEWFRQYDDKTLASRAMCLRQTSANYMYKNCSSEFISLFICPIGR